MASFDVKIENRYPPNFELIKAVLPYANEKHVYCYGDTLYVPDGHELTPDIVFHESIHVRQQGSDPDAWWNAYLTDTKFRLDQEIAAYGEQWQWVKEHITGNSFRKWLLEKMAFALSGKEYGNMLNYQDAEAAIRNYGR